MKESALNMKEMLFKGVIAENYIQNELLSYGNNETYSWSANTAEIEFIIETSDDIIPVEVKAGNNTKAKSLTSYKNRYKPYKTVKLIGSVGGDNKIDMVLPLYHANELQNL